MKRMLVALSAVALLGAVPALAGPGALPKQPVQTDASLAAYPSGSVVVSSSQQAADALQSVFAGRVSKESPILVASMVQLDDLKASSTLGRMVMQQVGSRLSQYGYRIVESRMRQDMAIIPHEGEFMLTRELARLMQTRYEAQAVLVGSYVEEPGTVYFSLRLIRLDDGAVVAAYEYHLPNRGEVRNLIRKERRSTVVDVDPVWTTLNKRQDAFAANGIALPPVRAAAPAAPVVPTFQGNTFQGGAGASGTPGVAGMAPGIAEPSPQLGPPDRMMQAPEPDAGMPVLGPPDKVIR